MAEVTERKLGADFVSGSKARLSQGVMQGETVTRPGCAARVHFTSSGVSAPLKRDQPAADQGSSTP